MEKSIYQVKGILGGSVLFPVNVSSAVTVEKIEWDFYPQGGGLGFWLGEFSHGKLEHPSPTDRFGQWLDMVDETTLKVKELELDDSGLYNARIWFTKAQFQEQSFSLIVYEPVPELQILPRDVSNSSGICNVTLQCQVCGKGEFDISWKRGEPLRDLGDGLDWYQISDNGTNLHLLWWPNAGDSNFTCLVRNPIGEKDISFSLLSICQTDDEEIASTMPENQHSPSSQQSKRTLPPKLGMSSGGTRTLPLSMCRVFLKPFSALTPASCPQQHLLPGTLEPHGTQRKEGLLYEELEPVEHAKGRLLL